MSIEVKKENDYYSLTLNDKVATFWKGIIDENIHVTIEEFLSKAKVNDKVAIRSVRIYQGKKIIGFFTNGIIKNISKLTITVYIKEINETCKFSIKRGLTNSIWVVDEIYQIIDFANDEYLNFQANLDLYYGLNRLDSTQKILNDISKSDNP